MRWDRQGMAGQGRSVHAEQGRQCRAAQGRAGQGRQGRAGRAGRAGRTCREGKALHCIALSALNYLPCLSSLLTYEFQC